MECVGEQGGDGSSETAVRLAKEWRCCLFFYGRVVCSSKFGNSSITICVGLAMIAVQSSSVLLFDADSRNRGDLGFFGLGGKYLVRIVDVWKWTTS